MKIITIVLGVILVIGGIFCMVYPAATFSTLGWLVGILLLISGVNAVANYVRGRKVGLANVWDLVYGILTLILATVILFSPLAAGITDVILIYMFAFWLLIGGIIRIVGSIALMRLKNRGWIWMIILGLLMVVLGIYSFFHPMVNAIAMGWMMGFFIIFQGFNLIGIGSTLGGGSDKAAKA